MNSLVSLPLAGVAVASPSIAAASGMDSQLADLGNQFDSMVARINDCAAAADELYDPISEAIWAQATWPVEQKEWSRDDANRYWETYKKVIAEIGSDWETATNQHEQAYGPCDDLTRKIWTVPADSVAGLAVKAKAAALANAHLWDKPFDDLNWDKKSTVSFIEATFAAASLPPPAEYLERSIEPEQRTPKSLAGAVDPAIALAARAVEAWNDFEAKCSISSDCEDGVIEWKNLNPQPTMRATIVGTDEDYLAFQAGRSAYDPNADLAAAVKEPEVALKAWGYRKRLVESETGYTRAASAQRRASERFSDIRDELVYVRPITVAGLRAKAHAARVSADEDLQQQIVFDIGVLFGELDYNEKPVA